MIQNDNQLDVTYEQLGRMYRALAALRKEVLPLNPRQYSLFAEAYIDQIHELRADIDAYLGLDERDLAAFETGQAPRCAKRLQSNRKVRQLPRHFGACKVFDGCGTFPYVAGRAEP